jgi:hypothetical protein
MRNRIFILIASATLASLIPALASAGYRYDKVNEACQFLSNMGLRAGEYRHVLDGPYRCSSHRKELPVGGATPDTIRYLAEGGPDSVIRLKLDLEVNSLQEAEMAHQRLLKYARQLIKRALDSDIPDQTEAAIRSGTPGEWPIGGAEIRLEKVKLGMIGYTLNLYIE